jgi:CubicO group peptidase (beta-lactamase class C family)
VRLNVDLLRERIASVFAENFARRGELGASIAVWHEGEPLLALHGGFRDAQRRRPWAADTIVLTWSATKGVASACLLHVLQEHKIVLDRCVAEFWPAFAQNGKAAIPIAQLLSHSAGLCALDEPADILDYSSVIAALEHQRPLWLPGAAHGYHARTFGFLLDELVRRIAGTTLASYWRQVFADPLELDFWIGLPAQLNNRCATIYAPRKSYPPKPSEFYRQLAQPGTLPHRTFGSPRGLTSIAAMNKPEMRALDIPSLSGIGSAAALAQFYALLATGGQLGGRRFFNQRTIGWMTTSLADGTDLVFGQPTAFSAGFMKNDVTQRIFGPGSSAFGHPGAGGSNAFADPACHLSFAYVMNQMEQSILPNEKSICLTDALYSLIPRPQ